MKRFPTGFKCLTVSEHCPWFTVDKIYTPIYKDEGVFVPDDEPDNGFTWKLTKSEDDVWLIEIENHIPRIIATFNEQD